MGAMRSRKKTGLNEENECDSFKYILMYTFFSNLSDGLHIWNHLLTEDTMSKVKRD